MKNYLSLGYQATIRALFRDNFNLIVLTSSIVLLAVDYFIWNWRLESAELYVVSIGTIFPVQYLFVIWLINLILAVFSYDKEKEISYLLLSASCFVGLLVLILEIYYLIFSHA